VAIFPTVAVADIDDKLQFVETTSSSRFTDLQERKFDVLIRVSTFTLRRDRNSDRGPNLHFCPGYFYGGQSLMANSAWSLSNVDGKKIAVSEDFESQYNLDKFLQQKGYTYTKITYPSLNSPEMFADYEAGNVDAVSSDKIVLLNFKSGFSNPGSHQMFDVTMSRDLLCPVVLYGDDQWTDLVSWAVYSLCEAEELGLNSTNINAPPNLDHPAVEWFLGIEGTLGEDLGLTSTWAKEIIRKVGNYQEIYERNIGSANMAGGPNRLYTMGGVLYAPLMR
jgi:general L-amino acid transport system substrate-binding protein